MTPLTDEQLDELEGLAEKITTTGSWDRLHIGFEIWICDQHMNQVARVNWLNDATYIAAADPPTVLALVREVRRLRRENFALNECVQYRFHDAVTSDVAVVPLEDYEAMKARIVELERADVEKS